VRRFAAAAVILACGVMVAVAGAQDFAFSAKAQDNATPVGAGITNRGVTGAGTQLVAVDRNPPGVRVWNAGSYASPGYLNTTISGTPTSLALFPDRTSGRDDVAVLSTTGIQVGSSNGAGGLNFQSVPFNAFDATDLAVGDFNADGLPDLLFVEATEGQVGIALNNGANGFLPPRGFPVAGLIDAGIGVGHFNKDSTLDIVAATSHGLVILLGLGDGTFGLPQSIPLSFAPTSITAADIDLDGLTDVAVSEADGTEVMTNQTTGAVEVFSGFLLSGSNPIGALIFDVNGDNRPDVLALNRGSGTVTAFIASPGGGFIPDAPITVGPVVSVTFGRINDDALQDLAVVANDGIEIYDGEKPPAGGGGSGGTPLPFVPTPHGPGTGHKQTSPEQISPPKSQLSVGATISGTYFWDINMPFGKKALACGLFDAKTKRQIKNPLFAGVTQKMSCRDTKKTRVVHGEKKEIIHIQLDLTTTNPNAKGKATVWTEIFWK